MAHDDLEALFDLLPDATIAVTEQLDILVLNEAARRLLRLGALFARGPEHTPPSERHPKAVAWLPEDSRVALLQWLRRSDRVALTVPVNAGRRGALDWLSVTARSTSREGRPLFILGLRPVRGPELEGALAKEDYRRLREAVTSRRIGIYEHNHLTDEIYGSGEIRTQYGIEPTAPLSIGTFAGATHPDDAQFLVDEIRKAHDPNGDGVFDVKHRIRLPSGETRWLHTCARTRFTPVANGSSRLQLTTGSCIDITATHETEEVNRRLAAILDGTPDLVATTDLEGRLTYLNPAGRRLLGLVADAPLSNLVADQLFADSSRELFRGTAVPWAVGQGVWTGELVLGGAAGDSIPASVVLLAHEQTRSSGAYLSLHAHDLTQQKHLEAQLHHSQKLEAVGRLAGGVAHDFNNLLSVILGYTALASLDASTSQSLKNTLGEVTHAANRAAQLTSHLLSFSRKQVLQPRVLDAAAAVEGLVPMLRRLVGEQISISFLRATDESEHSRIVVDPSQLEQVVMNLVVNARDAIVGEGQISLEVEFVHLDERFVDAHPEVAPGPHVLIAISDTGEGMNDQTLSRIFEPFFTTKEQGRGTGLGLSTVFGIVKQSGGTIWVYSEPGHGTTFKIYFPATSSALTTDPPVVDDTAQWRRGTVLVVEDELQLRKVLADLLSRWGHTPLVASGPVEALALARARGAEIDLILTDVVMPQMTGKQLADTLAAEGCPIPVLFMSGYTENTIVHHGVLDDGVNFIAKPIAPERLRRRISRLLAKKPG